MSNLDNPENKPILLDLFCGAGGATYGYMQAGFYVVGVDNRRQPHYVGNEFHQADALEYVAEHGHEFDAIASSPPCQKFSKMRRGRWQDREHPDLIPATRDLLIASGKLYVIENVEGAPLKGLMLLCGSMFGLQTEQGSQLRRHRVFEHNMPFSLVNPCQHNKNASVIGVYGGGPDAARRRIPATVGVYGHAGGSSTRDNIYGFSTEDRKVAMGIDWMTGDELSEAIPPAYTNFIGKQLITILDNLSDGK